MSQDSRRARRGDELVLMPAAAPCCAPGFVDAKDTTVPVRVPEGARISLREIAIDDCDRLGLSAKKEISAIVWSGSRINFHKEQLPRSVGLKELQPGVVAIVRDIPDNVVPFSK